jgi:hypothetical protein
LSFACGWSAKFLRRDAEGMAFGFAPPFLEAPVEAQHQQRYQVQRGEPTEAERREASLMRRYRQYLEQRPQRRSAGEDSNAPSGHPV